jgi:hypothetical protein
MGCFDDGLADELEKAAETGGAGDVVPPNAQRFNMSVVEQPTRGLAALAQRACLQRDGASIDDGRPSAPLRGLLSCLKAHAPFGVGVLQKCSGETLCVSPTPTQAEAARVVPSALTP